MGEEKQENKISNGVIFSAKEPLATLLKESFPVDISLALVKLNKQISAQWQIIEEVRLGLIKKYGDEMENGNIGLVAPNNPEGKPASVNWGKFATDANELFNQETTLSFEKVKLPRKVTVRCDKCKHVIEKPLEIDGVTLMALEEFVEI